MRKHGEVNLGTSTKRLLRQRQSSDPALLYPASPTCIFLIPFSDKTEPENFSTSLQNFLHHASPCRNVTGFSSKSGDCHMCSSTLGLWIVGLNLQAHATGLDLASTCGSSREVG